MSDTQTSPTSDGWWDSASDFVGSATDTFTTLASGYFNFKTAEVQADANGQSQAQLGNTVETQTAVGRTPLSSEQYNQVTEQQAGAVTGFAGLDQKTLLIGAAVVALLIYKR